jgi:hypothetical protein
MRKKLIMSLMIGLLITSVIPVVSAGPVLEIDNIRGGFGVHAIIKNTGNASATNVNWSILMDGFAGINFYTIGNIPSIRPGTQHRIWSGIPLGMISKPTIKINANCTGASADKNVTGVVFFFFVLVVK